MGLLNILKANWTGKVGQTVGAKWKNKSTLRSYTKPAYTNTPAQQIVRAGFGSIASFVALFADQIKSLSALNTKGMSVRNAIIRLNKEMVVTGVLEYSDLLVSRGGLPNVAGFSPTLLPAGAGFGATWTPLVGPTISARAKVVAIFADDDANFAVVGSGLNVAGSLQVQSALPPNGSYHIYYYLLDYRGSSRVASMSSYIDALLI